MANRPNPSGVILAPMARTASPATASPVPAPAPPEVGGRAGVTPAWSRPDDATRQAQLDAMKWRATGLLGLAAIVFVAASAFEGQYAWLGYLRATAEASLVGGLADWFAVTALFRHPLGLPIPHTALIPANWQLMAARVGTMVGDRVLTAEYVTREISRVDVADLLARAAGRVRPADLESVVGAVARWAAAELPPDAAVDLVAWLRRLLLARPLAPLLAELLEVAHRHGWDQRVIEALAGILVDALQRPDFREAVADLVDGVVGSYRERMGAYPSLLIGLAKVLGLINRDRLVSALH